MNPIANPHSPVELANLSMLVHYVMGWLLLFISLIQLFEAVWGFRTQGRRYLWPVLGILTGFGFMLYIFLHMLFYHQTSPFILAVQNQHQLIGVLVGTGATIELLSRIDKLKGKLPLLAWPIAVIGVAIILLMHPQSSLELLIIHVALSASLILSGLSQIAFTLSKEEGQSMRILGILLLAAAAIQLVLYQEKPSAHAAQMGQMQ